MTITIILTSFVRPSFWLVVVRVDWYLTENLLIFLKNDYFIMLPQSFQLLLLQENKTVVEFTFCLLFEVTPIIIVSN